jgi:hypothetical protein
MFASAVVQADLRSRTTERLLMVLLAGTKISPALCR